MRGGGGGGRGGGSSVEIYMALEWREGGALGSALQGLPHPQSKPPLYSQRSKATALDAAGPGPPGLGELAVAILAE